MPSLQSVECEKDDFSCKPMPLQLDDPTEKNRIQCAKWVRSELVRVAHTGSGSKRVFGKMTPRRTR
jgi:hypothetical protein